MRRKQRVRCERRVRREPLRAQRGGSRGNVNTRENVCVYLHTVPVAFHTVVLVNKLKAGRPDDIEEGLAHHPGHGVVDLGQTLLHPAAHHRHATDTPHTPNTRHRHTTDTLFISRAMLVLLCQVGFFQ